MEYGVVLVMLLAVAFAINSHEDHKNDNLQNEVSALKKFVFNMNIELDNIREKYDDIQEKLRAVRSGQRQMYTGLPKAQAYTNDDKGETTQMTSRAVAYTPTFQLPNVWNGSKAMGPKGQKGDSSPPGGQGLKGTPGSKGQKGDDGKPGITGPKGLKGDTAIGPRGEKGDSGQSGMQGVRGTTGLQGLNGYKGLKGDQGPIGMAGQKGSFGTHGANGQKGDHGNTGSKGDRGYTGYTGNTGQKGVSGRAVSGAKGIKGDRGYTGYIGNTGQKGEPGRVVSGTSGSPVAFYVALQENMGPLQGQVLRYTRVLTNHGSAYDPTTGMFRAPTSGVYVFNIVVSADVEKTAAVELIKDDGRAGNLVCTVWAESLPAWSTSSNTVYLNFNAQQQVYLIARQDISSYYYANMYTTFSGHLVTPF